MDKTLFYCHLVHYKNHNIYPEIMLGLCGEVRRFKCLNHEIFDLMDHWHDSRLALKMF